MQPQNLRPLATRLVLNFMLKLCYAVLIAVAACTVPAFAQDSAPAATTGPVQPFIIALAKEWFYRFQTGNVDRSQLDAVTSAELTRPVTYLP